MRRTLLHRKSCRADSTRVKIPHLGAGAAELYNALDAVGLKISSADHLHRLRGRMRTGLDPCGRLIHGALQRACVTPDGMTLATSHRARRGVHPDLVKDLIRVLEGTAPHGKSGNVGLRRRTASGLPERVGLHNPLMDGYQ